METSTSSFTSDPAPPAAAETRSDALWRTLLEATGDGVLVVGAHGAVLATNPAFSRLFAFHARGEALEGLSFQALCERLGDSFADTTHFLARAAELEAQDAPVAGECWTMTDGRVLESDVLPVVVEGQRTEQLWLWRDVTERARLHPHEANLTYLDELTGLYNRRGFLRYARAQLDAAALARRPMLLIFVDLDGLKYINDQLGHAAGDRALVDTSTVLKASWNSRSPRPLSALRRAARRARRSASRTAEESVTRTTNSSPPRRATMSRSRKVDLSTVLVSTSARSPAA